MFSSDSKHSFTKQERLCSKKIIEYLFEYGESFLVYPFRVVFKEAETGSPFPVQVLLTVPKRNFRKASQRNLIKRKMREAYRMNKHILYEHFGKDERKYALVLSYIAKEIIVFDEIDKKIMLSLQRLCKK